MLFLLFPVVSAGSRAADVSADSRCTVHFIILTAIQFTNALDLGKVLGNR